MKKLSKNVKLNKVLNYIMDELEKLGIDEVKRYCKEFKNEIDYNIAQYGNLTIYYADVREIYKDYKTFKNFSDTKVWEIYKKQVGYCARKLLENY